MAGEKFCFCLKLETGCLLLGFTTFLLSMIKILVTIVYLKMNGYFDLKVGQAPNISTVQQHVGNVSTAQQHMGNVSTVPKHRTFDLTLSKSATEVILAFVMIILFLWMVFSVLMMIGIVKKRVNFVMTYFLFGIAISILYLLSGLLEAISGLWAASVVTIVLTLVYIKCLTSVYIAYDQMRQGKASDLEYLINEDEPVIES